MRHGTSEHSSPARFGVMAATVKEFKIGRKSLKESSNSSNEFKSNQDPITHRSNAELEFTLAANNAAVVQSRVLSEALVLEGKKLSNEESKNQQSSSSHNVDLLSLPDDEQINKENIDISEQLHEMSKSATILVGPGQKMTSVKSRPKYACRSHIPADKPNQDKHDVEARSMQELWYNGFSN